MAMTTAIMLDTDNAYRTLGCTSSRSTGVERVITGCASAEHGIDRVNCCELVPTDGTCASR